MLTATAAVDGTTVTLSCDETPNPLATEATITAVIGGRAVYIIPRYRQINSATHADTCTWKTAWKCTCAPIPADPAPLFAAAKDIAVRWQAGRNAAAEARPYSVSDAHLTAVEDLACCPSKATGGPCTCC